MIRRTMRRRHADKERVQEGNAGAMVERLFPAVCSLCSATHAWPENPEACALQAAKTGGEGDGPSF